MERLRKFLIPIMSVVMVVVAVVYYNVSSRGIEATQREEQVRLQELTDELNALKTSQSASRTNILSATTGIDYSRVAREGEIGRSMFSYVGSWNSWNSYTTNREALMQEYHFSDTDQIVTELMPEVGITELDDGENYNIIDSLGLNMKVTTYDSYLVGVDGNTYTYLTEATLTTTDSGRSSSKLSMIMYSTDGDGNIFDVTGTMVS